MPASIPIKHRGTLASRAAIRPRAIFSRKTICPLVVEADQMQGVLACIDANGVSDCSGCLWGHGDVLLVLLSPRSSSERFGAGARPVRPIRDKSQCPEFTVGIDAKGTFVGKRSRPTCSE